MRYSVKRLTAAGVLAAAVGVTALVVTPDAHAVLDGGPASGIVTGEVPEVDGQRVNSTRWVVQIQVAGGDGACTGAVFDDRWVVTAKHCVSNDVASGDTPPASTRLKTDYLDGQPVRAAIERVFYPESADIALLKLTEPYLHSKNAAGEDVRPLGPGLAHDGPHVGDEFIAYGFGNAGFGLKAAGKKYKSQTGLPESGQAVLTDPADVTLEYPDGSVLYPRGYMQPGDSGGPLVLNGEIIAVLIGGDERGDGFAIIKHSRDWIDGILSQN